MAPGTIPMGGIFSDKNGHFTLLTTVMKWLING
jgi:hypothetical protein